MEAFLNLVFQEGDYFFLTDFVVFVTNVSSDGKTGRHRHANEVHFSQVGTFTTKFIPHISTAFSFAVTECVNSFSIFHCV